MALSLIAANHNASYGNSTNLGVQMKKPKYPQYAVQSKRLESFKKWPSHLGIKPETLAEAGLVYTGVGDAVRCYHCGGGLRNWESGDNPWTEHAKWYKDCPHVILVKGQSFAEKISNGDTEQDCEPKEAEEPLLEEVLVSPAALSCIQMGYSKNLVRRAIQKYMQEKKHSYFKGTEIAELCEQFESCDISKTPVSNVADCVQPSISRSNSVASSSGSDNLDELLAENQRLKDNVACKICLEDQASVIFVNCGHIIACPQCAPALSKCPMCREPVEGYVKAIFA